MSEPLIYVDSFDNDSDFNFITSALLKSGPPYTPVIVDSTFEGSASGIDSSALFGGVTIDGVTYKFSAASLTDLAVISKSTDGGATWINLDAAHGPVSNGAVAVWDGDHTIVVAWRAPDHHSNLVAIKLMNFDLTLGTWGPAYGTSSPPLGSAVGSVWIRGTDIVVLYTNRNTFNSGDPSGIATAVYDTGGGSWTLTNFDLGATLLTLPGWDATKTIAGTASRSVLDATGTLHFFFFTTGFFGSTVIWTNRCFYQQFTPANTLGSFFDFPGQVAPLTGGRQDINSFAASSGPFGVPNIIGDTIVLPISITNRVASDPREFIGIYLGTPVSAPVWTLDNTKSIDPTVFTDTTIYPQQCAAMVVLDGVMWAIFTALGADGATNFARLRLCQSSNLLSPADGWSAVTIFDLTVDTWPSMFSGQVLQVPSLGLPFTTVVDVFGNEFR